MLILFVITWNTKRNEKENKKWQNECRKNLFRTKHYFLKTQKIDMVSEICPNLLAKKPRLYVEV